MIRAPQLAGVTCNGSVASKEGDHQKLVAEMTVRFMNNPRWDAIRTFEPSHQFRHRAIQTVEAIVSRHTGERVVLGQRLMQAASDIFLGWTKGHEANRYLYVRQLRDMKASADVESMDPSFLAFYARICGWTLARAHARSGDPIAIASYLGKSDRFDSSIADFSRRYADQNERDYEAFTDAIRSGRLDAVEGL